jgi:hypothetical protein
MFKQPTVPFSHSRSSFYLILLFLTLNFKKCLVWIYFATIQITQKKMITTRMKMGANIKFLSNLFISHQSKATQLHTPTSSPCRNKLIGTRNIFLCFSFWCCFYFMPGEEIRDITGHLIWFISCHGLTKPFCFLFYREKKKERITPQAANEKKLWVCYSNE